MYGFSVIASFTPSTTSKTINKIDEMHGGGGGED